MIRYLYGDQLARLPELHATMFRDRAALFSRRLGWPVTVDAEGFERDEFDALNPLYVIWQNELGQHGGSLRLLPTTGPTMANSVFTSLSDRLPISSPLIWEVTRFCVSDRQQGGIRISAALMLAALELGRGFHLEHALGVFDARMLRLYRRLGWTPDVIGTQGQGAARLCVGLWDFNAAPIVSLQQRACVDAATATLWFRTAFNAVSKAQN